MASAPVKAKITVGEETVDDVVKAALEVFSAPTEALGWLGDQIRVHRVRSGLKALRRTEALARECGVRLTAPPTKFLAQFLEACSLEEESDDELIERWANLLLNVSNTYNSEQIFFCAVLKQLSAIEVELLEVLARNRRGVFSLWGVEEGSFIYDFHAEDATLPAKLSCDPADVEGSINAIIEALEMPGTIVADIFADAEETGEGYSQWQVLHPDYDDRELVNWDILQASNLVRGRFHVWRKGDLQFRVRLFTMTELGARFYFACHPPKWRDQMNTDVPLERRHAPAARGKKSAKKSKSKEKVR